MSRLSKLFRLSLYRNERQRDFSMDASGFWYGWRVLDQVLDQQIVLQSLGETNFVIEISRFLRKTV
jgi:hypothetical protein